MGDQESSNRKAVGNRDGVRSRKLYPCKFCDEQFSCSQALGGHQNGHKNARLSQRNSQNGQSQNKYDSQHSLTSLQQSLSIPYPPPHFNYPFAGNPSHHRQPVLSSVPHYGTSNYFRNHLLGPSINPNRYQPYQSSPNRIMGLNRPVLPGINPNHEFNKMMPPMVNPESDHIPEPDPIPNTTPRLFGKPLFKMMNTDEGTSTSSSIVLENVKDYEDGEREFMEQEKSLCIQTDDEHSLEGNQKSACENNKDDEEEGLDLTLHL